MRSPLWLHQSLNQRLKILIRCVLFYSLEPIKEPDVEVLCYSIALFLYCLAKSGPVNTVGHIGSLCATGYINMLTEHQVWDMTNIVAWSSA